MGNRILPIDIKPIYRFHEYGETVETVSWIFFYSFAYTHD